MKRDDVKKSLKSLKSIQKRVEKMMDGAIDLYGENHVVTDKIDNILVALEEAIDYQEGFLDD